MSNTLYIAATGPASGKSLVVLGVMQMLSGRIERIGFFRPVIHSGNQPDNDIELVRHRFGLSQPYESLYAVTGEQARDLVAEGKHDELLQRIVTQFKQLQRQCDFVLCEGTDFSRISSVFEFDFNARVANHLGCPILIVSSGKDEKPDDIVDAIGTARLAFRSANCTVAASFVNRVAAEDMAAVETRIRKQFANEDPVFVLPEKAEIAAPTIGQIMDALDAKMVYGDPEFRLQEVLHYSIAAMQLPNFLERVADRSLVITPGDRADIILGCFAMANSNHAAKIAGLILSGDILPAESVMHLIEGLPRPPIPILLVSQDTHATSAAINEVRGTISADNYRKIELALGVFESHVDVDTLERRIEVTRSSTVTPLMFEYEIIERAKQQRQHIVLPEGDEDRILIATESLLRRGVVDVTLLGNEEIIRAKVAKLGLLMDEATIVDPAVSPWRENFANTYQRLRQHKGVTPETAADIMMDVSYFGTMMVYKGMVDGMVSGSAHTTAHTIRPAFEIIKTAPDSLIVSSVFFMCLKDQVLVYGDCAINPNPNAEQLADIAISSAETASSFGIEPRIAMLSYSTGQSGAGDDVTIVQEATRLARAARPDLKIEGPIQYDAAIDASVAKTKLPNSEVAGRATVFIFPDLNTGNNTYKAVQRSANAVAVGPVLQGLKKPVNDLSRGCTVADIINTVAITAVQAQLMSQQRSRATPPA